MSGLKHYVVEYRVIGTFIDQVYDVDNKDEAIEKAIDHLRDEPINLYHSDVEIMGIYEVNYESGLRKKNNDSGIYTSK